MAPGHRPPSPGSETLWELLRGRAERQPHRHGFTFLLDGETAEENLDYAELDRRARAIGAMLQSLGAAGERVLLLYPPGLDYVAAVFGCLYAGAVAVFAFPPRLNRLTTRLQSIAADAQPKVALSTSKVVASLGQRAAEAPELGRLHWLATDVLPPGIEEDWREPRVDRDGLAFLQYTSGSTGSPKGVMLSHANVLHNLGLIQLGFEVHPDDDRGVIWLPIYHDMGLIGGVLEPIYVGLPVVLMPSAAFLQRPLRWLAAISRYRATSSGGPDFAYRLCVEKVTPEMRAGLDLSTWRVAFCGAEPIRAATLEAFAAAFAPCGFRREAFYPCYGMAETTLIVTGGRAAEPPVVHHTLRSELERHRVVEAAPGAEGSRGLVGCGQALPQLSVAIVDPETGCRAAPGAVGEVWVAGPSVAQGYWRQEETTAATFGARLSDTGEGPFLRTGDLGYLAAGELFITGRWKDLIIIRGNNFYPQDLELTAELSHPVLRRGSAAAFAVEVEGEERLVVVHEVERNAKPAEAEAALGAIRAALAEEHGLSPHAVVLIRTLSLPKTSSGKVQRFACRSGFLAGELEVVAEWRQERAQPLSPAAARPAGDEALPPAAAAGPTEAEIRWWLATALAAELNRPAREIDPRQPFAYYGLDSARTLGLSGDLEQWLGRHLEPTLLWEHPTPERLARYLAGVARGEAAAGPARARPAAAEAIAIIGLGCRFPGAHGPEAFWRLLRDGVDAVSEAPPDRWDAAAADALNGSRGFLQRGGFLAGIDGFDPRFFAISHREAARIDPQQRLLLETAWEALEDAGEVPERLAGSRTGVFIGISTNDYSRLQASAPELIDLHGSTGNAFSVAANRISYTLDLRGPSLAVDTACSSSLVAVHLACKSLRSGECDLAVAGGVNLILSPAVTLSFARAGALAADGRCKAFDARADGFVRSEGVGCVVLKRLSEALADNDPICAVLRGTAVAQDGRTNGLMAPSREAQEAVLRAAYADAGVAPGAVDYVEAHGTGTLLGDPIEARALGSVLAEERPPGQRCAIGSVKTNLGHLEAAAGIAGLIKVALALRHRWLPPSLHFREPNPHIPFADLPLAVQAAGGPWPTADGPALAGVSSFGFGGTNAHVVIEEAPPQPERPTAPAADFTALLPLSAHSEEALRARARDLLAWVQAHTPLALADLAYTLGERRAHLDFRLSLPAASRAEAIEGFEAFLAGQPRRGLATGRRLMGERPGPVFVFCGQGPQRARMGLELAEQEPVFRAAFEECDRHIRRHGSFSVLEVLAAPDAEARLADTSVAQPALFALQVALAALWRHWGIEPGAVVGHSVGEVAAAHMAGVLDLPEAARIVVERGRAMQRAAGRGRMAAVALSPEEAQEALAGLGERLVIAAVNAPRSIVLSGEEAALEKVLADFDRRQVRHRRLPVEFAFHSGQMEPHLDAFERALADGAPRPAALTLVSTVTGAVADGSGWNTAYWRQQIRCPVRFGDAVGVLIDRGHDTFVELGPHPVLGLAMGECLEARGREGRVLASLSREAAERAAMLGSLGALYCGGEPVRWPAVHPGAGRCLALPTYPWQHERCWLEIAGRTPNGTWEQAPGTAPPAGHPLLGRALDLSHLGRSVVWENDLDARRLPYLLDHRFEGAVVVPAAVYLEMALAAAVAADLASPRPREVRFHAPLILPEEEPRRVQVVLSRDGDEAASFRIFGRPAAGRSGWTLHASGSIQEGVAQPVTVDLDAIRQRCTEELAAADYYPQLALRGLDYGPAFRGVGRLWRRPGEALGEIETPASIDSEAADYRVHPALLDACGQVLFGAAAGAIDGRRAFLPAAVEEVTVHARPGRRAWSHARLRPADQPSDRSAPDRLVGDVRLFDEAGRLLIEARGLCLRALDGQADREGPLGPDRWFYRLAWEPAGEVAATALAPEAGSWLIFADEGGVGEGLAGRLAAAGNRCVVVREGTDFEALEGERYRIRPGHDEDMWELLRKALSGHQAPCRGVAFLWGLEGGGGAGAQTAAAALEAAELRGPRTVLYLLQGLARRQWMNPPRLWVVTRGAQTLDGEEAVAPALAQAPLWGFGRTVAQEQPAFWGGLIDLETGSAADEDARCLHGRVTGSSAETQVAIRHGQAHVARLTRRPRPPEARLPLCRADGSYLVTGGLGALGLQVARWLVAQGARRLVLLGRSELPPRERWKSLDPSGRGARQVDAIRGLEALGASVHLASVDIAEEGELRALLERYEAEAWPPIRGVVHAAGVLQDRTLEQLDATAMAAVFRGKVLGASLLDRLLGDRPLDFFVLFSSTASLLGSAGQANYAAANAFLDALAHGRRAAGRPALAVNWGPWAETGLAAQADRGARLQRQGIGSLDPGEALEVLGRLLHEGEVQAGVMAIDWRQLFTAFPDYREAPLFRRVAAELGEEAGAPDAGDSAGRVRAAVLGAATAAERRRLLVERIREQVARVVGLTPEKVDPRQPLNTVGIDSLMGLEFKNRVEVELGVVISVAQLFEGPSIERLADLVARQLEGAAAAPAAGTAPTSGATPEEPAAAGTGRASLLHAIQPRGSRPPLFCLHPGALDAHCYQELSRHLGDDQPFFVLRPPELDNYRNLDDATAAPKPLDEVADGCVEALVAAQGRGPYQLSGWSMGGVLAFLIAQRLWRRGEKVALLALFDSPAPQSGDPPQDYDDAKLLPSFSRFLGARIGKVLPADDNGDGSGLSHRFERLLAAAREGGVLPADAGLAQIRFLFQAYKNGLLAAVRQLGTCHPPVYPGALTLFRVSQVLDAFDDIFPDNNVQWSRFTAQPLRLHDVPGDHYTMFLQPNVQVLGERLNQELMAAGTARETVAG
jgi:acyl transferase domain-containing protein/acyl-CoA synthetase (AMP-forming)/AMP-acid ligase II/thioesterase domain-containing protein/acyl carrier protein